MYIVSTEIIAYIHCIYIYEYIYTTITQNSIYADNVCACLLRFSRANFADLVQLEYREPERGAAHSSCMCVVGFMMNGGGLILVFQRGRRGENKQRYIWTRKRTTLVWIKQLCSNGEKMRVDHRSICIKYMYGGTSMYLK